MTKVIWLIDWMFDDGKEELSEEVAAWRASVYRWIKITLFLLCAGAILWWLGDDAAWRASQPYEGLGTIVWLGDASYDAGSIGTKGRAASHRPVSRDGAFVLVDGFAEPLLYRAQKNTLDGWLKEGERVRVKYRRGTFLFWEKMYVNNVMKLDGPDGAKH